MAFELPSLPYSFGSLEPHIDALTMEIHHDRHHNAYVTNLNNATAGTDLEGKSLIEILNNIDDYSAAVRNNGGGHYNHSLFWTVMSSSGGGEPEGDLAQAINARFGSFDKFKNEFSTAAATRFGSGWAWLCKKNDGEVEVCSSPNQDNPVMPGVGCGGTPILGLDVWEHAYYLNYQNKRPDYIAAFWNIIKWEEVAKRYAE